MKNPKRTSAEKFTAGRPSKEPANDGFPPGKDVSAPPPGSDQSRHKDKKR